MPPRLILLLPEARMFGGHPPQSHPQPLDVHFFFSDTEESVPTAGRESTGSHSALSFLNLHAYLLALRSRKPHSSDGHFWVFH